MNLTTVVLFFVYTLGYGYTITSLLRVEIKNFLERNLMRIGIGLSVFIILGIFLSLVRVPLDWRIFLALSVLPSVFFLYKNKNNIKPEFKLSRAYVHILIMLILFSATFYMYHKGAFAYPYLEDDDSWSHAVGVKYVSVKKTVFMPAEEALNLQYINPYPPSYDLIIGVLHQTSPSLYWTLKYFNALFISLSIIFFYFFVKKFANSSNKALYATFALAMIPCYLSHFIWAIALCVPLYFVAFYCTEYVYNDRRWIPILAVVIASVLIMTPTHSMYFGFFFVFYLAAKTILEKKFNKNLLLGGFLGLLLSFLVWWGPMIGAYGLHEFLVRMEVLAGPVWAHGGTGDRVYSFGDFVFAKDQNMINSPIGVGVVLVILLMISIIFIIARYKSLLKKENHWMGISLLWLAFTFYAVNAANMPVKLSPFRVWMLFAIPVCILVAEGTSFLIGIGKEADKQTGMKFVTVAIMIILVLGVWYTSGHQKYTVNTTSGWPPGAFWSSMEEIQGYMWLKDLPPDTKVFSFTNYGVIIGLDKFACAWCNDEKEFKNTAINQSAKSLRTWLNSKQYDYVTIGGQEVMAYGINTTNTMINDMISSGLFQPVYQTQGVLIFKVI